MSVNDCSIKISYGYELKLLNVNNNSQKRPRKKPFAKKHAICKKRAGSYLAMASTF